MRIGIYVGQAGVAPGLEKMASGHLQVPLHSAALLAAAGHDVSVITTRLGNERVLPDCFLKSMALYQVRDATRQGDRLISEVGRIPGYRLAALGGKLLDLRRVAMQQRFDVMHFFGGAGTVHLASLFKLTFAPCRVVATINVGGLPHSRLAPRLWRQLDGLVTSTGYLHGELSHRGFRAGILRHGIVRDIQREVQWAGERRRFRVLFWREATWRNGGDLAIAVFRKLAPRFPEISFDFALRPHWKQAEGIADLVASHSNVHLFQAPYPSGISLGSLLAESICVLQPFREFTIQPQFSILETMVAGVPVVACDVQSTRELIDSGKNGLVVENENVSALTDAVESLLSTPEQALVMGKQAALDAASRWNWDEYVSGLARYYRARK
jgi:glycosyltransferase involved in cell wall biosynthesis